MGEGLSQSESARRLGVSRSTVCSALKRLELDSKNPDELADTAVISIDMRRIIRELESTNDAVNGLLSHLRQCHQGTVKTRMSEKDISILLLKSASEARHWSKGFSEILGRLTAYDETQKFKKSVVSILVSEVSNEQKTRILKKIKEIS
ncbi:MAG: hypothetical protein JXM72_12760 [Deltaproteobacteria bacterium]|nr:hypothetical protein [Deltaproteobacteria bacterium]